MSRGQTPRRRHDGPLRTGGGLAQTKRRGGCRADSCGHAATGESPGMHEASEPWRVALQAGPEGISLAVRTNRNAGKRSAPKPCSRPLSDHRHAAAAAWVGSVRRHRALSQHWLRLRPSRTARQRIAHQHLATPRPPRGCAMRTRGAVDRASRRLARDVAMPCWVGSGPVRMRRTAAPATASRRRIQRGAKHVPVNRRRSPPMGCVGRCARARAGDLAALRMRQGRWKYRDRAWAIRRYGCAPRTSRAVRCARAGHTHPILTFAFPRLLRFTLACSREQLTRKW